MLKNKSITTSYISSLITIWRLLDWIYPPFCCNCNQIGYEICPDCWDSILLLKHAHVCRLCGKRITKGVLCSDCKHQPPAFDQLRAWAEYQGAARQIAMHIKFHSRRGLIPYLIQPIAQAIRDWGIHIDIVVPVPLANGRLKERGFNQSDLLARPVAGHLGLSYTSDALVRIRETHSQVGLTANERHQNILGAFQADPEIFRDRNILIIDDIATTGATLSECAATLKQAGASKVYCFTVARTGSVFSTTNQNLEVSA
jgi:ComF family protein